jgi:phosphoribosyl 1,2-cyclic phosphate phosphodiesterase
VKFSVTFLGTGTSTGIPLIGCSCPVCHSKDPKDTRLRPSILVGTEQGNLLVDTTPDMRTQMLRARITNIEAVLLTHIHADHLMGMDDVRQFNFVHDKNIPLYATPENLAYVEKTFSYCFTETQAGGGKPRIDLTPLTPGVPFTLCGIEILPVLGLHGEMWVTAYVFDNRFAYATDINGIPDTLHAALKDREVVVLGTVREEPHPTHFGFQEALDAMASLTPRRGYLTHLSHHLGHKATSARLPENLMLAYDGLTLSFD